MTIRTRYLFTLDDASLSPSDIRQPSHVRWIESRSAALALFRLLERGGDPWAYTLDGTPVPLAYGGLLSSPTMTLWALTPDETPESVQAALAVDADPYPDALLTRGPRGGAAWSRA